MQTLQEYIIKNRSDYLASFIQFESAVKIISSKISKAGLEGNLGLTGTRNVYGEKVKKLDDFANSLFIQKMKDSGQVHTILSEELENPQEVNPSGEYIFAMDPLDGSSNIDTHINIGTIFSLYSAKKGLLQAGKDQLVAGYVMYGSSTILVLTFGDRVHGFTLDEEVDSFFLTHENIRIPKVGKYYSINEGYHHTYPKGIQNYLDTIKKSHQFSGRYVGTMVADVHRTLLKGGIFIYPTSSTSPEGKLRLLYEASPMSMIIEVAGGKTTSVGKKPLDITPTKHDQTIPIALGSVDNINQFNSINKI